NRESLRDVALATQALSGKAYHLGFGKYATKSNLSKANKNRDYHIFEEFAYYVIADARKCRATDIFKLNGHVYAFDSTTIELCLETFK
ncbi:MAG: IS4 family transposase, partial [Bacteroidales bacterium]|nr:IS4 family transposase [Bacteroidota bacterium]NLO00251.1 IS4 family transposase [Bacteroidales bacterium]